MENEIIFLLALALTLGAALLVVAYLRRSLRGILVELTTSENRAAFWTTFSAAFLMLMPLVVVILMRSRVRPGESVLFHTIDLAGYGLAGLLGAMSLIAFFVAVFAKSAYASVRITPDHLDELERLLSRIEEVRAHNILRRAHEPPETAIRVKDIG